MRVNWTIPAPLIIAIVGQAIVLAFLIGTWKSGIESTISIYQQEASARAAEFNRRLAILENGAANNIAIIERVKGVEVNIEVLKDQNQRIEKKLDRTLEKTR